MYNISIYQAFFWHFWGKRPTSNWEFRDVKLTNWEKFNGKTVNLGKIYQ